MSKKENLTELLTQNPPDVKKLMKYGRTRKNFDGFDLGKLAYLIQDMKKKHGSQVTPLHVACSACMKPEIVKTLVNEGSSVNNEVEDVGSPLGLALDIGNIPVAKLLIDLGADVKQFYSEGVSPMFFALTKEEKKEKTCVTAVKLLLESGVCINAVVNNGTKERAIHIAVDNDMPLVVRLLLQKGANLDVQDEDGFTPIHIAVQNYHLDMVKLLLRHDADLYKENKNGETVLLMAVKIDNCEIVKELAKSGCDINRLCSNGKYAPLHCAVYFHRKEMIRLLVGLGANTNKPLPSGTTPLHALASRSIKDMFTKEKENSQDRKELAEFLVENGAILNAVDKNMNTPLHVAIESGYLSLAKLFVKLGADFNIRNRDGDFIFHQVVPLNRDIIILLLEFGGDYKAYDENGITPYHLAITSKVDLKYIKSFVKHGCPYDQDPHICKRLVQYNKVVEKFFASEKKFFKGVMENNLELVKRSVMEGAVPTSCCEDIKFPLHFVALQGFNEILIFLLEEKNQPNTLNNEGKTPLFLAASKGLYETCCILLRYGACYNYRSKKCPKTPKMVASELKHNLVVSLFERLEDMFLKARSKEEHVVKYLKGQLENNSDYVMFVNAIDIKGNTLLATALQYRKNSLAEAMLKMRLQCNFGSDC